MQVVWFKRDLRVSDHQPLASASAFGECLCLYVYEPELVQSSEFDASHLNFINESLTELNRRLKELGGRFTFRVGSMPGVLDELHCQHGGIDAIWSHEETGNKVTFDRDRRVARWARDHGVTWNEIPQNGVVRRLRTRDGWSRQRSAFMKRPVTATPTLICTPTSVPAGSIQSPDQLGLSPTEKTELQVGGEAVGQQVLDDFLSSRGENYNNEMSSPVTAWNSCSRLSPYLAWGCLSMKSVTHALHDRQAELRARKKTGESTGGWLMSLKAYESRLSWHCHFMQKLEEQPRLEIDDLHPGGRRLRPTEPDPAR